MLAAVKGIIQGNTVIIDDENLQDYQGKDAIVTILDFPYKKTKNKNIDWDSFFVPTERGKDVDSYMKEMRDNDRL